MYRRVVDVLGLFSVSHGLQKKIYPVFLLSLISLFHDVTNIQQVGEREQKKKEE
jgi:hypothetical protein